MNKNKKVFVIMAIIFFMVVANYFIEPTESEESGPEESEEMKKLQKEFNQLSIDYLNLQGETEELQKKIQWLLESKFETYKRIFETDYANQYIGDSSEIIHKVIEEDKFMLFVENDTTFQLSVWVKEQEYPFSVELNTLNPKNGFAWQGGPQMNLNFYGGVITDNHIHQVQILYNDEVHDANIIEINDNLHIWYSIFDYQRKSINEPNQMNILALDNKQNIVWEEEFRAPSGG